MTPPPRTRTFITPPIVAWDGLPYRPQFARRARCQQVASVGGDRDVLFVDDHFSRRILHAGFDREDHPGPEHGAVAAHVRRGSVSWSPRPWPSRPTLFPIEPAADTTAAMLRQTSSAVAPGRAALIPASVASHIASCARFAALDRRSPTA